MNALVLNLPIRATNKIIFISTIGLIVPKGQLFSF